MMAAIMAARNGADVTLYEKNNQIGKKLLATGNGKCNLTNLDFKPSMYNTANPDKLAYYLGLFDEKTTIRTFNEFGLMLKDKNGYIYPKCEQATVVLDVLLHMLDVMNVKIITEHGVDKIVRNGERIDVYSGKDVDSFDSVILSTGSKAGLSKKDSAFWGKDGYYMAGLLGHSVLPVLPALVQVECEEDFFKEISGVRAECVITLYDETKAIKREFGELQITDYGISGIPVFQMSSEISARLFQNQKLSCVIDFLPEMDEEAFEEMISDRIKQFRGETVDSFLLGMLNKKLCSLIIKLSGLAPELIIDESNYTDIFKACIYLKQFVVTVKGTKGFDNAQVCRGGIPLTEVDNKLQSVFVPGLYICGELLDVDGRCGGYNLQWAWTSGAIAGVYAAR